MRLTRQCLVRQRGFTLLELAVSAGVLALLGGVLLEKLVSYAGESEHVAAKQLVGSLRTALAVRSARAISTSGKGGLLALSHENPMVWLTEPPQNYLGEYYAPNEADLPGGNWYFDRAKSMLVYLPSAKKSFSYETSTLLRFKVELLPRAKQIDSVAWNAVTEGLELSQVIDQSVATSNQVPIRH
ncbi:prepilin-type N-terminal cleavage/methylation domain-containing protein [Massilia niabensis]|uniref:Prepilin-type N-terminal cleavage/methylation domain-containing protein n=1 Tax=Massilia niabensis TaxID=544910 RepID=A0ABW0L708_9BURK